LGSRGKIRAPRSRFDRHGPAKKKEKAFVRLQEAAAAIGSSREGRKRAQEIRRREREILGGRKPVFFSS
jgi:hypothetical protein